jgi:hypothetical protein
MVLVDMLVGQKMLAFMEPHGFNKGRKSFAREVAS